MIWGMTTSTFTLVHVVLRLSCGNCGCLDALKDEEFVNLGSRIKRSIPCVLQLVL